MNKVKQAKKFAREKHEGIFRKDGVTPYFEQARFVSLDKNIIQPLADQWKFVEVEKVGRNR